MEAGRIGVGGLPGKVPDGLVGCVIDPQNVDQVSCLGCSSADDVEPDLEPCVPSVIGQCCAVVSGTAIKELISE